MNREQQYIAFMLECIARVEEYVADGKPHYDIDVRTRDAIERRLEELCDMQTRFSPEFLEAHTEIDWRTMRRFRNVLAHQYDGIDPNIVWNVATNEVPKIKEALLAIVETRRGTGAESDP